jgi:1,4-dihydroxy-2-naphthoate octaprenyltransferase
MPLILFFLSPCHPYSTLAGLLFFPAIPLIKTVFAEKEGPVYNNVLAGTGMLLFVYSIVFSLGWIL